MHMLSQICLLWIGYKLNAPVWYHILMWSAVSINFVKLLVAMYKAGEKSKVEE